MGSHSFPTLKGLTNFIETNCKPEEFKITELDRELKTGKFYATKISEESAVKMGFKL